MYVAQVRPQIDAAGAEKDPFRTENNELTNPCSQFPFSACAGSLNYWFLLYFLTKAIVTVHIPHNGR